MPDTVLPDRLPIAEEDPQLMPLLKATFRTSGLRVLTAGTGTQALEVARAERPDLLLLEVGLPELNGDEDCQTLKTDPETAAIRVVMLTARAGLADQRLADEASADAYLTKPISPTRLIDSV